MLTMLSHTHNELASTCHNSPASSPNLCLSGVITECYVSRTTCTAAGEIQCAMHYTVIESQGLNAVMFDTRKFMLAFKCVWCQDCPHTEILDSIASSNSNRLWQLCQHALHANQVIFLNLSAKKHWMLQWNPQMWTPFGVSWLERCPNFRGETHFYYIGTK